MLNEQETTKIFALIEDADRNSRFHKSRGERAINHFIKLVKHLPYEMIVNAIDNCSRDGDESVTPNYVLTFAKANTPGNRKTPVYLQAPYDDLAEPTPYFETNTGQPVLPLKDIAEIAEPFMPPPEKGEKVIRSSLSFAVLRTAGKNPRLKAAIEKAFEEVRRSGERKTTDEAIEDRAIRNINRG